MSKIIMEAHKTCTGQVNKTKELVYIQEVNAVKYLYTNGKPLNFYINSSSKVVVTTLTAQDRPDLNIKPLEIKIT